MLIKGAIIHTAESEIPMTGDIRIQGSVIAEISDNIPVNEEETVLSAEGLHAYPGFIDAHCHLGMTGFGTGWADRDVNESNDPCTPQLRAIDTINPQDRAFRLARKAGITTIATGPGSTNVIAGTWLAMKTAGTVIDEMVIRDNLAMKAALGENPKSTYQSNRISSRMTSAAIFRDMIRKAQEYDRKLRAAGNSEGNPPVYDEKCEALLPVVRGEMPVKMHVHQANDICTAIRLAQEFRIRMTLEHVTDGWLIPEALAKSGMMLAVGPAFIQPNKKECENSSWETPAILASHGCHICIISDSPVTPIEFLPLYAGISVKHGLDEYTALRAITINAAEHLGISDRTGSLKTGKDADIVLFEGSPFEVSGNAKHVIISGKLYDSQK